MKPKLSLLFSVIVIVNLFFPILSKADYNQESAQNYLLAHSNNPWPTMALSALGANNIPADYLKNVSGSSAINFEAPILAITSLNQNPKTFGSIDYVAALESYHNQSQLGDITALNDDFFGILALASAGVPINDQNIIDSKNFILAHQNGDGGWGWSVTAGSDSNDTAAAIMALVAAGASSADSHIASALAYLKTDQGQDGGFLYDPSSGNTDSSSTSWVVWALDALGVDPQTWTKGGNNPMSFLVSYQNPDGSFKWLATDTADASPSVTADAVIALSGKTLPLKIISAAQTFTVNFRIEGSAGPICTGQVAAITAIDVVKNASASCGFTYDIKSTGYGPYLDQINSDAAFGNTGWIFLDNNVPLQVGAADFAVQPNDNLLIYFGGFDWQPLKLDLSAAAADSGQSVTAAVQSYNNNALSPLSGANVYFGNATAATDSAGTAVIAAPDGYYKVYAEKSGYIRSNQVALKVGRPASSAVSLSANFSGGQAAPQQDSGLIAGTSTPDQSSFSVSFTVDVSNLDFGAVSPGSKISKSLTVQNTGSVGLSLSASVSGDPLFTDNLSLNNKFWQNFSGIVGAKQNSTLTAGLNVPSGFAGASGPKTGQLVLWASPE